MRRLARADVPIPYNRNLELAAVPQEQDIEREIRRIVSNQYKKGYGAAIYANTIYHAEIRYGSGNCHGC